MSADVMQVETSPGVYVNVKGTADGNSFTGAQIGTAGSLALGLTAQVTPYGTLRVSQEPGTLLNDTFEGALDTVNRWTASGTVPPTTPSGSLVLVGATTANATSILTSKPTFVPTVGFLVLGFTTLFDAAKVVNCNSNTTVGLAACAAPTSIAPVDNGYVWERDITGELSCNVYLAGVKYCVNSTNPALITPQGSLPVGSFTTTFGKTISWPAGNHTLILYQRGDLCFWFLDSFDTPVGLSKYVAPAVQNLPIRVAQINAAAGVIATTTAVSALVLGDSASQSESISDPVYPWQRLYVANNGAGKVETSNTYNHINTSTTTVVKNGPGNLHSVTVNQKGTVASLTTIYDNTAASGAVIGIMDSLTQEGTSTFDVAFNTGLTIVTTGTVAPDITVSYR